ncbi:MAG: hypothetical protein M3Y53_10275 [Thermoproteota archaeon]|nr:hypothetical protein [Thermoproteota archaeon]
MLQLSIRAFPVLIICFLIVLLVLSHSVLIKEASAHITKKFGNIQVEIGWSDEPPLTGQLNNVIVDVNQTGGKTQTPIINALANMNILVKYGGVTKSLDFLPSPTTDGSYLGKIIPSRVGSYNVVLNGTIQGQKISSQIPLDLVESSQKLAFPDTVTGSGTDATVTGGSASATTSTNTNNIGPQLQRIVSQLANQIDSVKSVIGSVAKSNADTMKSVQDVKSAADRSYLIGMVGIGAGVAGIVIAAFSLSRKRAAIQV